MTLYLEKEVTTMLEEILWQRVRRPGHRDCTVTEVSEAAITMREAGSDYYVTIPRDRIVGLVPADATMYGGAVKCWTLQFV